jgi:hypothetical protein
MADNSAPFEVWPVVAGAVGAVLSLRFVVDQSPLARGVSVASSFAFSWLVTPGIAEYMGWGMRGAVATGCILGLLGANLMGAIWKASQEPLAALKSWWAASRGQP